MNDCVIIGYHETELSADEPSLVVEDEGDLPVPVRNLRRSQLSIDGGFQSYLDALAYVRRDGQAESCAYTVAELPSLGTVYLANYLRSHGHSADFVNSFTFEQDRLAELLGDGPRSVAITTTFYMVPAPVIDIVRFVRERAPGVPIIVGGPLVDNNCRAHEHDVEHLQRFFDRVGADIYVWESQGEAALEAVVAALKAGGDATGIPNVFTRSGRAWTMSGRRPENNDLDECVVRWASFDPEVLGPTLSTRTARSCAFKCAFCDYPERAGGLTLASVDTVERELEELARMGVRRVAFIDDTFNVPTRRFKELCRMMVRRDFGIEWFSYFRCGHAREPEVYDLMHAAGCRGVLLGIESADDQVLRNMDKRATRAAYSYGIEQLRRRGIFVHASLVIGFPGETPDTVRRTIDFLDETGPDTFACNHWYYLHSTPVHHRAAEFDLRGKGYKWSHRTMDSRRAMEAADEIFASVTGAAWMPVTGLDFWGVPYMLGKGMTHAEIVRFLELAKPLTASRVARSSSTAVAAGQQQFEDFCRRLPLTAGRYRRTWSDA